MHQDPWEDVPVPSAAEGLLMLWVMMVGGSIITVAILVALYRFLAG